MNKILAFMKLNEIIWNKVIRILEIATNTSDTDKILTCTFSIALYFCV